MPARSTAEMCTNTSLPPSLGWMKPKPFWPLNHLTVPVDIFCPSEDISRVTTTRFQFNLSMSLGRDPRAHSERHGSLSNEHNLSVGDQKSKVKLLINLNGGVGAWSTALHSQQADSPLSLVNARSGTEAEDGGCRSLGRWLFALLEFRNLSGQV